MRLEAYLQRLDELDTPSVGCADSLFRRGLALSRLGRSAEAFEALEKALQANPLYAEAAISAAFALGESGRAAEGFARLRRQHAATPDDVEAVLPMGVYCMRHGWKDAGLALLLRAERLRPTLPYVAAYAAAALLEHGDEPRARERLERAQELIARLAGSDGSGSTRLPGLEVYRRWENPLLVKLQLQLARFCLETADIEGAEEELAAALTVYPGYLPAMLEKGRLACVRSGPKEAARWFNRCLAANEACHEAHFELAFLHAEGGRFERAVEALQTAVALRPFFPDYRHHLGMLLMALGRKEAAIEELKKALVLEPGDGHASVQLGIAYLEAGKTDDAIAVLEASPCWSWPETLLVAAEAYARSGRREKAVRALEGVLAADATNTEARELLEILRG